MPAKLKNLRLDEVSLVDKGANQHAFVALFKRHSEDEQHLEKIVRHTTDEEIEETKKQLEEAQRELVVLKASEPDRTTKMENVDKRYVDGVFEISKRALEQGPVGDLEKHHFTTALQKRAAELRQGNESLQQAFAKAIVADPISKTIYQASKLYGGRDIPETAPRPIEKAKPPSLGPANQKMQVLADDHHKGNSKLSPAQAYERVYNDPANRELRQACVQEHMANIQRAREAGLG